MEIQRFNRASPKYPALVAERLGTHAPAELALAGNSAILGLPLTALFCSNQCPGSAILRALDLAAQLRDSNRAVISGFHTPVEKECLAILLRGKSPIVICPARSLDRYRIPADWKSPLAQGRLLLLSPFPTGTHRATAETAQRRNEFVAALADEVHIAYASPGGHLQSLIQIINLWGIPHRLPSNRHHNSCTAYASTP
jgi:predicted Rossmann fold nucleotide-binding protein DprA/Smf involved in DNA uptake